MGKHLNKPFSVHDVDVILFLVDVTKSLGTGDKFVINSLKDIDKPVILILNKIDKIAKSKILPKIEQYMTLYDFDEIVPISALNHDNLDHLLKVLKKYMKDSVKYYEDDQITNVSKEFMITEFVREKILILLMMKYHIR